MSTTIKCTDCGWTTDIEETSDTNPCVCPVCQGDLADADSGRPYPRDTVAGYITAHDGLTPDEAVRVTEDGDEIVTIDGLASSDPIDGAVRVRVHGESEPVDARSLYVD